MFIGLTAVPFYPLLSLGQGGTMGGGGGKAVVCRNLETDKIITAYALDLFEAENPVDPSVEKLIAIWPKSVHSEADYLSEMLTRLEKASPERVKDFNSYLKDFDSEVIFSDQALADIPDSYHLSYPRGCHVEQLIIQKSELGNHKRYLIDHEIWNALNEENRAIMKFHEVFLRELKTVFEGVEKCVSEQVFCKPIETLELRHVNALLFSNRVSQLSTTEWLRQLATVPYLSFFETPWTSGKLINQYGATQEEGLIVDAAVKFEKLDSGSFSIRIERDHFKEPVFARLAEACAKFKNGALKLKEVIESGKKTPTLLFEVDGAPPSGYPDSLFVNVVFSSLGFQMTHGSFDGKISDGEIFTNHEILIDSITDNKKNNIYLQFASLVLNRESLAIKRFESVRGFVGIIAGTIGFDFQKANQGKVNGMKITFDSGHLNTRVDVSGEGDPEHYLPGGWIYGGDGSLEINFSDEIQVVFAASKQNMNYTPDGGGYFSGEQGKTLIDLQPGLVNPLDLTSAQLKFANKMNLCNVIWKSGRSAGFDNCMDYPKGSAWSIGALLNSSKVDPKQFGVW